MRERLQPLVSAAPLTEEPVEQATPAFWNMPDIDTEARTLEAELAAHSGKALAPEEARAAVVAELIHRVMVREARERREFATALAAVEYLQQYPNFVRSLTRHLTVAGDLRRAGFDILPLTVKDLREQGFASGLWAAVE